MKKLLKKLGYGIAIHYNEYSDLFEVYNIGEYSPGNGITEKSRVSTDKDPETAIKNYIKRYKKSTKV